MSDDTFAALMERERTRLNGERDTILGQQQELQSKLDSIAAEMHAIDAYERAKSGQPLRAARAGGSRTRARRGSKREELLKLLRANPTGLARKDILDKMGLRGDKSGEMSVSNALTALTKNNNAIRREGKYYAAAA